MDLLLTDVVMPEMSGKELFKRIAQIRPGIRGLFMSGYTADIIARRGVLDAGVDFIQKPFSLDILSQKIRKALDGLSGGP
jgi:FixJ family two-component response regulator